MSFWDLSDGDSAAKTGDQYEVPGGNLDPIPAGSSVLAIIDEAKWERKQTGEEFISLRWSVVSPDEYKNRKVFHKLWVTDLDPQAKDEAKGIAKRDKARRMLAAIDANAGGKLTAQEGKPSDDSMALHLCNKPMIITLMEWSMRGNDGSDMSGNWVSAVAPKSKGIDVKAPSAKAKASSGGASMGNRPSPNDLDDEIPFACEWRI
jgi:hypothetical protein